MVGFRSQLIAASLFLIPSKGIKSHFSFLIQPLVLPCVKKIAFFEDNSPKAQIVPGKLLPSIINNQNRFLLPFDLIAANQAEDIPAKLIEFKYGEVFVKMVDMDLSGDMIGLCFGMEDEFIVMDFYWF